jgi:hypothetical protein
LISRPFLAALALLSGLCWPWTALAQPRYSPDEVKAAFLYNFAAFTEWPAQVRVQDGLVIGVLNAEEVEAELRRQVAARPTAARKVEVKRVEADDLGGVHILYIGAREGPRLARLLPALRDKPVLVVTDAHDGLERGSMINFLVGERVQFEIALDNATRVGLRLSSRLLSVAVRVKKGSAPDVPMYAGLRLR